MPQLQIKGSCLFIYFAFIKILYSIDYVGVNNFWIHPYLIINLLDNHKDFLKPNFRIRNGIPSYTIEEFKKGLSDDANLLFIEDGLKSGVFKYDKNDHTSKEDGSMIIKTGNKRFVREFSGPVNVQWFGAKGDGITNDFAAFNKALFYASKNSDSVFIPKSIYFIKLKGSLIIQSGIKFYGEVGSIINLDSETPAYSSFITNNGKNIKISTLTINRAVDYPFVIFPIRNGENITFENITIDGGSNGKFKTSYCHGFQLGVSNLGKTSGVIIKECQIINCKFGLFMANPSLSLIQNIEVKDCLFKSNYSTDLEFNSPNGRITDLSVHNNTFSRGKSFSIGLAHVDNVQVSNNHFEYYDLESIHIEDYSSNINISHNTFEACSLFQNAYIQIISGTRNVKISNNKFDGEKNIVPNQIINAQAGGNGKTVGDRDVIAPRNIDVTDNQMLLSPTLNGIYFEKIDSSKISNNDFINSESSANLNNEKAINFGIKIFSGSTCVITKNKFQGVNQGIAPLPQNIKAHNLSDSQVISFNKFYNCNTGIAAINISSCTINANYFEKCEYPIVSGQLETELPKILKVFDNKDHNCLNPISILDTINVYSTSSVVTGINKTITIHPLNGALPNGSKIIFVNGSTLTLRKYASYQTESLYGDITYKDTPANVSGKAYGNYLKDSIRVKLIYNNKTQKE